jgi:hypothetical protein
VVQYKRGHKMKATHGQEEERGSLDPRGSCFLPPVFSTPLLSDTTGARHKITVPLQKPGFGQGI